MLHLEIKIEGKDYGREFQAPKYDVELQTFHSNQEEPLKDLPERVNDAAKGKVATPPRTHSLQINKTGKPPHGTEKKSSHSFPIYIPRPKFLH